MQVYLLFTLKCLLRRRKSGVLYQWGCQRSVLHSNIEGFFQHIHLISDSAYSKCQIWDLIRNRTEKWNTLSVTNCSFLLSCHPQISEASCLLHRFWNVAHGFFCPAASCHRDGIQPLSCQSCRAVPSSSDLGTEAGARNSVCEEHSRLRVLQMHPWQSWQRPGDLWPLCWHTPLPPHQSTHWSVCIHSFMYQVH